MKIKRLSQSLLDKVTKERNIVPRGELDFRQSKEVGELVKRLRMAFQRVQ